MTDAFESLKDTNSIKYELYQSGAYSLLNDKFSNMSFDECIEDTINIVINNLHMHYTNKGLYVYRHSITLSIYVDYCAIRTLDKAYLIRVDIVESIKNTALLEIIRKQHLKFQRSYSSTMLESIQKAIKVFDDTMIDKFK